MLGGEYKKESKDGLGFSLHWYYTDDDCEKTDFLITFNFVNFSFPRFLLVGTSGLDWFVIDIIIQI